MICDVLDDSFRSVKDHIDGVRDRENEVDLDLPDFDNDEEFDVRNSTHNTQVVIKLELDISFLISSRFLMMGQLSISIRQQLLTLTRMETHFSFIEP